jgi:predicted nucleic acid-binding protein
MPPAGIKASIKNLFSLPFIIKEPTQAVIEQTAEIMEAYQITGYDALFVATAKDADCQLISDDIKGHGKVTDGSVLLLKDYKLIN